MANSTARQEMPSGVSTKNITPTVRDTGPIEADTRKRPTSDSDEGDATASITSSILRYRQENGRSYHAYKDGKYMMPNDALEQDRLDLQHNLFLITFSGRLYLSPVGRDGHKLRNVLDVGTGTGLWALDLADEHPETEVLGVDLSPIQSEVVPRNLTYQVDDLEEPWTFESKFDFIYSRMMTGAFANWPQFFEQAYENLVPGGWLEVADICPIVRWVKNLVEGTKKVGRPFDSPYAYKEQIEAQGFVNVTQVVFKWPQNRWPRDPKLKEIGTWVYQNITSGLEALSAAVYTRVLGWSKKDLDSFLGEVRQDFRNPTVRAYWPIVVVFVQKPQ